LFVGVLPANAEQAKATASTHLSRGIFSKELSKKETDMQKKITPCLWFDTEAEEAANFYVSIFKNSKILDLARYGEAGPKPAGTVLTVMFELDGQEFMALNGGPEYTFTPAISLLVDCKSQEEVDDLWDKLAKGGKTDQCGWLTDKYGVSWQIVPTILGELLSDPDPVKSQAVMRAMLQMTKLDIKKLQEAYRQPQTA
jgi:predicted 3-demethylubiquinone-9 3-methyltransferase (glyoxalase superfamily)